MTLQELQYPQECFQKKKKDRKEKGRNIRIDYGLSNKMMISAVIPNVFSLEEEYMASATIDRIYGADALVEYHNSSMAKIDSFFQTTSFITLPAGTRDTLQMIYNDFYSHDGVILFCGHCMQKKIHFQEDLLIRGLCLQIFHLVTLSHLIV